MASSIETPFLVSFAAKIISDTFHIVRIRVICIVRIFCPSRSIMMLFIVPVNAGTEISFGLFFYA